jgi:hypothetical protein
MMESDIRVKFIKSIITFVKMKEGRGIFKRGGGGDINISK